MRSRVALTSIAVALLAVNTPLSAATLPLHGAVRDETGGALVGVGVQLRLPDGSTVETVTNAAGEYQFQLATAGAYELRFTLVNFATLTRRVSVPPNGGLDVDAVLHLALNADVTVTAKGTFANIADARNPAEDLIGIAQAASQGAITARQIDTRPVMRVGEVLETVPGIVITQHSGEGKANQYYLRGFNLDHGTDFATTVAGMPVNLPTHAHGQGYSDLNFLIPELVSGVQYSKGPYFADQGDFATAGAANISYANALDRPLIRATGGDGGYGRVLFAASPRIDGGHLVTAIEVGHDDGPWTLPDGYRKVNAVVRYSAGDAVKGFSITGMGYQSRWNSTDQIPTRAVADGSLGRFGAIDPTDGGQTSRYSLSTDWQRSHRNGVTRISAYGVGYDLDLFSNFTYFLDDPVNGDQREQVDHRTIVGAKISHRRAMSWWGRSVQNTVGVQLRNDNIASVALYRTKARVRLDTLSNDSVVETAGAVYVENDIEWMPRLRTMAGVRADGYRFTVKATEVANSGIESAGIVSPKGGVTIGPWGGTELYVDAGYGFHSNDARGTTIVRDVAGDPADRVTPLVRAKGLEVGVRTVAVPHLQSTVALWMLNLASELTFSGDAGTTSAGRPSHRQGVEWTNYYTPRGWLMFDADLAWSRGRFTDLDPVGDHIPGSVQTVASLGATVDALHNVFGSMRLRYFGPRPLVEDNSVQSRATTLVNLEGGYKLTKTMRLVADVFNLLNGRSSDIDYYYASRLPGEPLGGANDIHFHPTLPRTARINLILAF